MRKLLLAATMLALALPAHAQQRATVTPPKLPDPLHILPGNQPAATAPAASSAAAINFEGVGAELQKVAKDVVDKAIADLKAASQDAQSHNDKIAQSCWDAQVAFLDLLPVEWTTPPTEIGPALAIQIGRDLSESLTGHEETSIKVACAALIGDQAAIIGQLFTLLGLKAGLAAVGLPPLP
jgi:hypothetical protein